MDEKVFVHHLYVAVPELLWDDLFLSYLRRRRLITQESEDVIKEWREVKGRYQRIRRRMVGKPLFARIMAIAPEILNDRGINLLHRLGKIDEKQAMIMKTYLGIIEHAGGPAPKDVSAALMRARRMFGFAFADDLIGLMVASGEIDRQTAQRMRAEVLLFRVGGETIKNILHAKKWYEMLALTGSGLVDRRTIEAMRLSGIIDGRTAQSLLLALSYGKSQWTVFEGSKRAEGLAARMAYLVSGSFNYELMELLKKLGILNDNQIWLMEVATALSQSYNRTLMEQMTNRKFRVVPGEAPIRTYARASKETDDELIKLLAEAADNARREAQALAKGGRAMRSAEYALRARALHQSMRQVWEGVGYLTIFGERQVADAAISAADALKKAYSKQLPDFTDVMLDYQARSGIDSFISRRENTLPLSRRVYGNMDLWTKKIDRAINLALLQGKSAAEIAKDVEKFINPNVMGGVKYSAMRLGRTELANAFHLTTIRYTREMPWVQGYKWNKSSSHKRGDICDQYADDDHDGLGAGVFKKANVPGKPHPQCMCYLTIVSMTEAQFIKAFKAGRFNSYMNSRVREPDVRERLLSDVSKKVGAAAGRAAGKVVLSRGLRVVDRMLYTGGKTQLVNSERLAQDKGVHLLGKSKPAAKQKLFRETIEVSAHTETPRQNAENGLRDPNFDIRRKEYAALLEAERRANRIGKRTRPSRRHASLPDVEIDPFDEDSYLDILPVGTDAQSAPNLASSMYGTRGYRSINHNLRENGGDLDRYDGHFAPVKDLLEKIGKARGKSFHEWDVIFQAAEEWGVDIADYEEDVSLFPNNDSFYLESLVNLVEDFDFSAYKKHSDIIRKLDGRMLETSGNRFTYRISGSDWMGLNRLPTKDDVGLTFMDNGFVSMEGVKNYYLGKEHAMLDVRKRPVRYKVLVPDGTRAMRLNDFENEILASRGSFFQIMDVLEEKDGPFAATVHLYLTGQKPLVDWKAVKKAAEESEDFWDDIVMDF